MRYPQVTECLRRSIDAESIPNFQVFTTSQRRRYQNGTHCCRALQRAMQESSVNSSITVLGLVFFQQTRSSNSACRALRKLGQNCFYMTSLKHVPTTALRVHHRCHPPIPPSSVIELGRHRVIMRTDHRCLPSQGIKGAHIHEAAPNPSFFPSPTISAFSPSPSSRLGAR
ncbi:hypothetical protein IW262DRAFT_1304 [Armillaria fumosa]|nr:hypothetical protein IW262DRAFT_1304 [Armillaria fumosa]